MKRRSHATNALNHFAGWDPRSAKALASSVDVVAVLREAGAPEQCHVISDNRTLDGQDLAIADAVAAAEACDFASVLCCIPGRLAVYFGQAFAPRIRVLLQRPG